MNCYKINYAAVWVSGEKGPAQTRSVKEGTLNVLAENEAIACDIATAHVPNSPHEVQITRVQQLAKDVIWAKLPISPFAGVGLGYGLQPVPSFEESAKKAQEENLPTPDITAELGHEGGA